MKLAIKKFFAVLMIFAVLNMNLPQKRAHAVVSGAAIALSGGRNWLMLMDPGRRVGNVRKPASCCRSILNPVTYSVRSFHRPMPKTLSRFLLLMPANRHRVVPAQAIACKQGTLARWIPESMKTSITRRASDSSSKLSRVRLSACNLRNLRE